MENKALMDTSFSSTRRDYEVFLSFSGKDTRKKFTAHLYTALDNKGVHTFLDDEELRIGEEIGPALFNAIEQSRISIPIFSQSYASSKWCLQELDKVLQCYKRNHQIVLPIFLDVKPSDVRNQTGNFGTAFRKRKRNEEPVIVDKWRNALTQIGRLKGWVLSEVENEDESKLIRLVVERVLGELNKTLLTVTEHPIGLNSHVEYLSSLLNVESMYPQTDPIFVGICGMGGIGKTTMAKAVYNEIFKRFDGCSFLAEVREQASKHGGLVHLQNQLLNDIGEKNVKISQADRGSKLIKERLQGKKILLILDDVDHPRQLNVLAGGISWFGPGSRIIITTRDEHVLKLGQVTNNNIYKPEGLDEKQSLQLFSMHAFRKDQPPEDYMQLSKNMVSHAGGLPLTLEVLGSFLFDMNGKEKWECALQKLEKVLPDEVQNKLKISYDGLEEEEKDIFLDVACYFIGMKKDDAIYIWEACKFYPNTGLEVLIRKSLVRIGDNNELRMHDQLRDMGRRIVYVQSLREPGERTRLWSREEVMEVLQEHTGTRKVEGISLDFRTHPSSLGEIEEERETGEHFRIEDFSTMSNLRLLQVNGIDLEGNIEHLPSKIRWLCWQRCPLKIFPSKFYIEKLVVLDLSNSDIRQAWNSGLQNKQFKNMKVLNLSCCLNLVKSPDFSGFPQLNKLILENCTALVDVHESIVHLKKLVRLNLSGCIKITELPGSISTLHSLQQLILSSCYQLGKLPESIGYLRSLEELRLDDDKKINELPNSIENLSRLRCLSLINCHSLTRIPKSIRRITSLVELYLGGSSIVEIPDGIELLEKLEKVSIKDCPNINSIPKLPSSLNYLDTSCCTLLKGLPDLSTLKNLRTLRLDGCDTLLWGTEGILLGEGIQGIEGAESLEDLYVSCLMCFDIPAQDSFNNQPSSSSGIQQRYVIGINEINNGISLCLDFELKEDIWIIPRGTLIFETHIHKNGKQIRCTTSLHIEGMGPETTSIQMDGRKKISAHYSQGLNWFGIPLKITDEIGIERVETFGELRRLNVKCFIVLPH